MTIKKQLVIPTIHLGGTDKDELIDQLTNAFGLVSAAIRGVQESAPHARDYWVHTQGYIDWHQAVAQFRERIAKLTEVRDEIEDLIRDIQEKNP